MQLLDALKSISKPGGLLLAVLAAQVLYLLLRLLGKGLLISEKHLDGVYQLYSGLHRIALGDLPGQGFYPYLGLGPTYSMYPLFDLFGGTVFASQLSSNVMVTAFWLLSLYTLARFSPVSKLGRYGFAAFLLFVYASFAPSIEPGNSLLGARSFVTIVAAWAVYYFLLQRNRPFLYGIAVAVVLLWSNDYGIPTAIAMIMVSALCNLSVASLRSTITTILVAILFSPIMLYLLTAGELQAYFQGSAGVARDQFWYFVGYARESNYYDLLDVLLFWYHEGRLFRSLLILTSLPLLLALLIDIIKTRRPASAILFVIGLAALGAGMLSEIAGHKDARYYTMLYACYGFMLAQVTYVYRLRLTAFFKSDGRISQALAWLCLPGQLRRFLLFLLLVSVIGVAMEVNKLIGMPKLASYIEPLGGYVKNEHMPLVNVSNEIKSELENTSPEKRLLSEYAGIPDILLEAERKLPVDLVIHALGEDLRKRYYDQITNGEYIYATTTNPGYSAWQTWSLYQNWVFYRYIIRNYIPRFETKTLIFWKSKIEVEALDLHDDVAASCEVLQVSRNHVRLNISTDTEKEVLYEISLEYELSFHSGLVPIVGDNRLLRIESPLLPSGFGRAFSISPYERTVSFPFYSGYTVEKYFDIFTDPGTRSSLAVPVCRVKYVSGDKAVLRMVLRDI